MEFPIGPQRVCGPLCVAIMALATGTSLAWPQAHKTGWSFAGTTTTTLHRIACEGGVLGRLLGSVLTTLLSGPENSYALDVSA
ncbi:MAG: hypothetical protein ACYDA6_05075 [Solirubrobacteraceae bacterium]